MIKIIIDWEQVQHNWNRLKCWIFGHKWQPQIGRQECSVCHLLTVRVTERNINWKMQIYRTKDIHELIRRCGEAFKVHINGCQHEWNRELPAFPELSSFNEKTEVCKKCFVRQDKKRMGI